MTIVGLHPEELFDKMLDGELTPAEQERVRAHLQACDVCRFEYAARLDFQAEALELATLGPPPALPLRPLLGVEPVKAPRRRRARLVVWSLAAAALITASGAVASGWVGSGSWHVLGSTFAPKATSPAAAGLAKPVLARGASSSASAPVVAAPVVAAPVVDAAPVPVVALPLKTEAHARQASKVRTPGSAVATQLASLSPAAADAAAVKDGAAKEPAVKEPASAAKLFGEANQARRAGDVGRASGLYHLLQDQFPGSPEAELSRVTLALLLLDSGDAQGALSGFERYLASPSRGLEAEALVGRARALGRLGRRDLETAAWQEVQRKYPRSIYGRQASERLVALGQP